MFLLTNNQANKLKFSTSITSIFNCTIERAFKTAILCDLSKIHTGFLFSPKVVKVSDYENWGKINSSKKIYAAKSIFQKGGFIFIDRVIEREENKHWLIQVDEFQIWNLGFYKFVGKWETKELGENKIEVKYSYSLYSKSVLFYPLNWLFTVIFWRIYMKRVVKNIKILAYSDEPYQYS